MCQIMDHLHKYVPSVHATENILLPNSQSIEYNDSAFFETLFGGDQLTAARARGAIAIRGNHETTKQKLRGLVSVAEDWHTRMTLLKVLIQFWFVTFITSHFLLGYLEVPFFYQINNQ